MRPSMRSMSIETRSSSRSSVSMSFTLGRLREEVLEALPRGLHVREANFGVVVLLAHVLGGDRLVRDLAELADLVERLAEVRRGHADRDARDRVRPAR